MIIDVHYHPAFFTEVCPDEDLADLRRQAMAYYKTQRYPVRRVIDQPSASCVDKCFLLPPNYTTTAIYAVTYDQMKMLVNLREGGFFGFASIDPNSEQALGDLEYAFNELGLSGLKLHPSRQRFYPNDAKLDPIYELCVQYNKPIIFHSGFTWQPESLARYSHPLNFEEVAVRFPNLRFCLAHMGFPWVKESAMLLLKYPNVYADTAALYFDSAWEFYEQVFKKEIVLTWLDRSIRHQVMFGSNMPRWEQMRMLKALKGLGLREETLDLITRQNALEFLGEEAAAWLS